MIEKKKNDEIVWDLDKVTEYIHALKTGEYIVMEEFVRICAVKSKRNCRNKKRGK